MSVVFSMSKKSGKVPEKVIRMNVMVRGFSIMALGLFYNLLANSYPGQDMNIPFPLSLWGWNILTFIGAAQIITYYAIKLSREARIIFGLMITLFTPQIRLFLSTNQSDPWIGFLHFIFVSPAPHNPFIPYVALCFFSSIFGELFFEAMVLETRKAYMDTFKSFMKWGAVAVLIGIAMPFFDGGPIFVTANEYPLNEYPFIYLVPIMQNQPFVDIPGMLKFLLRGTPANLFYCLGMALLIIGICFYYIDILDNDNQFIKMLCFYGQISLTIFLLHYLWLFVFLQSFNIAIFFIVWGGYLGFLGFLLYIWRKEWGGVGTLEWVMTRMGGGQKRKKAPE